MTVSARTQLGIVGGGPAGLMLALLLRRYVPITELTGRRITIYGQQEMVKDRYSQTALRRVWRAQDFSHYMTELLHDLGHGDFGRSLQLARLEYIAPSRRASARSRSPCRASSRSSSCRRPRPTIDACWPCSPTCSRASPDAQHRPQAAAGWSIRIRFPEGSRTAPSR
ncbi:MAG: FAD-dependent monooxygenase, partial [Acidobacteriota bacterium]|nr:FAD-dependent monooxygenase [Acidobacteriota bacterium]